MASEATARSNRGWTQQPWFWALIGSALALVVLGVGGGFWWWTRPATGGVAMPTLVVTRPVIASASATASKPAAPTATLAPHVPTPTPSVTPSPTPEPLCGGPPEMRVLVVGGRNGPQENSDLVRIVVIDFVNAKVRVVPIPRDLIVELPADFVESTGYGSPVKLASVNMIGGPYMRAGAQRGDGAVLVARVLAQNLGVSTDHYVAIGGLLVDNFINAIGGITIYIPAEIDDPDNNAHFKPGYQVLDGHDAVLFARIRKDVGDLGRIERQTVVAKAILQKLLSPAILPQVPELVSYFYNVRNDLITDLTPEDLSKFYCLSQHMSMDDIVFYSVPKDMLGLDVRAIYVGPQQIYASVLVWDQTFVDWVHQALAGEVSPEG